MQTYSEYRPTGFDRAGAFLEDRHRWFVAPVGQNRDSGPWDESNFSQFLAGVGGESDTVEVHRFGHWGCGWFELILIDPADAAAVDAAEDMESALADYPVLDDMDVSEREHQRASTYWSMASLRERAGWCARYGVSIFAARRDELPEDETGELVHVLAE